MKGQIRQSAPLADPTPCTALTPTQSSIIPSSSPAFGPPVFPIRLANHDARLTKPTILPISLPAATLRPLAFRMLTKKYNLTLTSSALQALATFIGRYCGSGWREEGLAEKVLEDVAKTWKKNGGGLIVEGDGQELKAMLQNLEGYMRGGRLLQQVGLSHYGNVYSQMNDLDFKTSMAHGGTEMLRSEASRASPEVMAFDIDEETEDGRVSDPRYWLKVVDAFAQPRLVYNATKKNFEMATTSPTFFPDPSHKTQFFRHRYDLILQRLLRNESFQVPTISSLRTSDLQHSPPNAITHQQAHKLTSIANLLGRSGSIHVVLGLLTMSPTNTLAISDLSGSIALDLHHARPRPENGSWFAPGMIAIVDGIYEEENPTGSTLAGGNGVGGTIGGKFVGLSIRGPPCERRELTLGVHGLSEDGGMSVGGGFGWVDFLGVGSERASGPRMRKLEKTIFKRSSDDSTALRRGKMVIMGEVNLDCPKTLQALKKILSLYATKLVDETPMTFMLIGNFVRHAVLAGGGSGGSIAYKEYFDSLASTLSEFPSVLQAATFVFVPGDNDPWASAFSAGAAAVLPRYGVPEWFVSRIKKAFTAANAESGKSHSTTLKGQAVWTSNPARLCVFGPAHEIVVFRDNISGRLRRSAIKFKAAETLGTDTFEAQEDYGDSDACLSSEVVMSGAQTEVLAATPSPPAEVISAQKLVKTILDQGYLSPFPLSNRPVLWDYAGALQLYPLPTALVLVDPEAPTFAITYEGCHVMNPGALVAEGRNGSARWMEYDVERKWGSARETMF